MDGGQRGAQNRPEAEEKREKSHIIGGPESMLRTLQTLASGL